MDQIERTRSEEEQLPDLETLHHAEGCAVVPKQSWHCQLQKARRTQDSVLKILHWNTERQILSSLYHDYRPKFFSQQL